MVLLPRRFEFSQNETTECFEGIVIIVYHNMHIHWTFLSALNQNTGCLIMKEVKYEPCSKTNINPYDFRQVSKVH